MVLFYSIDGNLAFPCSSGPVGLVAWKKH